MLSKRCMIFINIKVDFKFSGVFKRMTYTGMYDMNGMFVKEENKGGLKIKY